MLIADARPEERLATRGKRNGRISSLQGAGKAFAPDQRIFTLHEALCAGMPVRLWKRKNRHRIIGADFFIIGF